jgi:hypothetical protein
LDNKSLSDKERIHLKTSILPNDQSDLEDIHALSHLRSNIQLHTAFPNSLSFLHQLLLSQLNYYCKSKTRLTLYEDTLHLQDKIHASPHKHVADCDCFQEGKSSPGGIFHCNSLPLDTAEHHMIPLDKDFFLRFYSNALHHKGFSTFCSVE